MLKPLAAALQGLGFGSAQVALQGLLRFVKTSAGALAGDRADVRTKRLADPATGRLEALQTAARTTTPDTQRPEVLPTDRPIVITAAPRAATSTTSRRAQAGGRRR